MTFKDILTLSRDINALFRSVKRISNMCTLLHKLTSSKPKT